MDDCAEAKKTSLQLNSKSAIVSAVRAYWVVYRDVLVKVSG
jgi:hypothetical protein